MSVPQNSQEKKMEEKVWTGQPVFPRTMSVFQLRPEEKTDLLGEGGEGGKGGEGGEGKNVPRPIFR